MYIFSKARCVNQNLRPEIMKGFLTKIKESKMLSWCYTFYSYPSVNMKLLELCIYNILYDNMTLLVSLTIWFSNIKVKYEKVCLATPCLIIDKIVEVLELHTFLSECSSLCWAFKFIKLLIPSLQLFLTLYLPDN